MASLLDDYQGSVDPAEFRRRLDSQGVPAAGQSTPTPSNTSSSPSVSFGMQAPATYQPTPVAQPAVSVPNAPVQANPSVAANPAPAAPGVNAQEYINKLTEAKKQASYAALARARDEALSSLNKEKADIQPQYYDQRNQVAAGAQKVARNFAEYMAARGGSRSGANAQAALMNNVATQGSLGALGRQEAAAYTDIARRTSDLNTGFSNQVAGADANAEIERMQAALNDYYAAQQRGDTLTQQALQNAMQQARDSHTIEQDAINNQRNERNDTANFTGEYMDPKTAFTIQKMQANSKAWFNATTPAERSRLAAENQQLAAQIGAVQDADGNWVFPQPQRTLAARAQDLNETQILAALTGFFPDGTPTSAQQQVDLANEWKASDITGVITPRLAQMYGLKEGTPTQAAKQFAMNNAIQQGQLAISLGNQEISRQNSAANIANMEADNARQDAAVKLSESQKIFAGQIAGELGQATSKQDVIDFFNKNAEEITKQLGADAAAKMKNEALAQYDTTKADAAKISKRDKAISAAQNDFRWKAGNATQKAALIKEYEGYYQ